MSLVALHGVLHGWLVLNGYFVSARWYCISVIWTLRYPRSVLWYYRLPRDLSLLLRNNSTPRHGVYPRTSSYRQSGWFILFQSVFFRFSILRMFRLLRVFRPFRYNHTILLCASLNYCVIPSEFYSTIEVMYLSVRRSQHALLAIAFFVVMVLTVFSTLLSVGLLGFAALFLHVPNLLIDILPKGALGILGWTHSSMQTATQHNSRYVLSHPGCL